MKTETPRVSRQSRRDAVVAAAREALDGHLTPSARRVLLARVEHPDATMDELAKILGYAGGAQVSYAIRCALNHRALNNYRGPGPRMADRVPSTAHAPTRKGNPDP